MAFTRADRDWTPARDARLTKAVHEGVANVMLAERFGCSVEAIKTRRRKLGLFEPGRKRSNAHEGTIDGAEYVEPGAADGEARAASVFNGDGSERAQHGNEGPGADPGR